MKLLIGLILVALLGLAGWYGWRWYTSPKPPEISLNGVESEKAEVIEAALQAVRLQPRSGQAWGKLSMVLIINGFPEKAIDCLAQAERFDPQQPRWPYLRGDLVVDNNLQLGLSLLRRALTLAQTPEHRGAVHFRLVQALIEGGKFDEAEKHLQALQEFEKDGPRLDYGLGLLAVARKDQAEARKHLSKLTDLPYARKKVCFLLASLPDGTEELARTYQKRAAELPMDLPWPNPFEEDVKAHKVNPQKRLAQYQELQRQGRDAEATDVLRRLVAESPDAEVCFLLGSTLFQMDQQEEAARALRQALHFDPLDAKIQFLLGTALLRCGENRLQEPNGKGPAQELFQQAIAAEDQALKLHASHAYAHLTRGRALRYLGRTEEAIRSLRQALACRPEVAEMHLALGEALAEAGQLHEALERLETAVRLAEPNDSRPRQALEKWRARDRKSSLNRPASHTRSS